MPLNTFPETSYGWYKRIVLLAWPIMLANLSVPLVGVVDTAVTGHLPDPIPMGAVAIGSVIFSTLFWVFGFLRMGTTGFIAQAYGQNDLSRVAATLMRSLLIAVCIGISLIVCQIPLRWIAFTLMDAPDQIRAMGETYFSVRIWGAPFTLINYCILGCLIGMQRTGLAVITQLILNTTNIVLDIFFVMYLGMEAGGVALASVIGEITAALFGIVILRSVFVWKFPNKRSLIRSYFRRSEWQSMFVVNTNLLLRTLFLTAGFFFFTAQSAQFGSLVLAANAVLMQMLMLLSYGLDGYAHAAETLTGSAFGSRNKEAFRHAARISTRIAVTTAGLITVVYYFFGACIIRLITNIEPVITIALDFLPWLVLAPLFAVWSYQFDGIFIGALQTKVMRDTVGFSLFVFIVFTLLCAPMGGNHVLWAGMMLFLALRGFLLFRQYPQILERLNH